jgi:apolipoprotein D and lipocalin family protein
MERIIQRRVAMHALKPVILIISGILIAVPFLASESTKSIPVVEDFDLNRYLGTWYEIARLPHRFEKDLINVTATYSLRSDGKIQVLNRGFKSAKNKWSEAKGKAWVPDRNVPARLRVSFFWPFAADYRVIKLDPDYQWAVVTSNSKDYLWILSRTPKMDDAVYGTLIQFIRENGFDLEKIIHVDQE